MAKPKPFDISIERKFLMMCDPMLASLIYFQEHLEAEERHVANGTATGSPFIAATDGDTIWYGPEYAKLSVSERRYVLMHEVSHGIFMHVPRMQLIKLQQGYCNAALANYAADAIINEAQEAAPALKGYLARPRDFPPIMMDTIHRMIREAADYSGQKPPMDYDPKVRLGQRMETVYSWLIWALNAAKRKREEMQREQDSGQQSGNMSGEGDPAPGDGQQRQNAKAKKGQGKAPTEAEQDGEEKSDKETDSPAKNKDGKASRKNADDQLTMVERVASQQPVDLEEALDALEKAINEGETTEQIINRINERIEKARQKIQALIQSSKINGIGEGGMLINLENDLPQPVVPWTHILRRALSKTIGNKLEDSYTRHGAPTRAALARGSRQIPYSPGTTIYTKRNRVLIVPDVSGSHVSEVKRCFAEIWSIAKLKNAVVDIATFDGGLQEMFEIKTRRDFQRVLEKGVTGAGGTVLTKSMIDDVRKNFSKGGIHRAMIVMTDGFLYPDFDEASLGMKIYWMITPGGTSDGLKDRGTIIDIPKYL